jgi:diadenosine tetraphosphatase ApaH/serine/threonine PP2A family protein phosphatase
MEILETLGSTPQSRFGHTMSLISETKAVLFGGATGDTGKYSITGETYSFDLVTRLWRKIEAAGNAPSPRAAHASAAIERNQLVIYGGATGAGGLASDDLYLLDIKDGEDKAQWNIIPVVGPTPGRRYGHTLTYAKPFLVAFGGNTGSEPVNDTWCLSIEKLPYSWQKLDTKSEMPLARVYHSAALCRHGPAMGMIVIFGGRSGDQVALHDAWGLRRHRSGAWDWVKAPYKTDSEQPVARYQHSSSFIGSIMVVLGGRTNNTGGTVGMEVYDTGTSEWTRMSAIQKFRHASWFVDNFLYIYGGFENDSPNIPTGAVTRINILRLFEGNDVLYKQTQAFLAPLKSKTYSAGTSPNRSIDEGRSDSGSPMSRSFDTGLSHNKPTYQSSNTFKPRGDGIMGNTGMRGDRMRDFKFASDVYVAFPEQTKGGEDVVKRQIPFDKFVDDGKKPASNKFLYTSPINNLGTNQQNIANFFLSKLLRPKDYFNPDLNAAFEFKPEYIIELCNQAEAVIRNQPIVLYVQSPIKIFGDIHGQYSDLMRFFDLFGSPSYAGNQEGDIESFDYLFLGDFVDRGSHSLETICLLLALKVKYPEQIHLIRGNHEDKWINNGFGFSDECAYRLGEDPTEEDSVFNRFNALFEWLPLAAVVDGRIMCLHGGIGSSLNKIEDIEKLERPLEVIHEVSTAEQKLVVDILWSDPTDSDTELGIQPNIVRDPGGTGNIVKFGPDQVQKFCNNNGLSLIIRAHECVMDGFERFAGGQLITLFSATDYCGRHKNAGAVLILKKNFEIIPKLIYPQNANAQNWIEDEETLKKRPPTPPRWKNTLPRKSSFE